MTTVAKDNPWAILLCKWNDDPSEPFSQLCCESLFSTTGVGLNNMVDYFRLYTHGNIDLSQSQVFGWFVLPQTRGQYTGSGVNQAGRQDLISWCIAAAAAGGVDVSPFFGVVCCLNNPTDLFGDIGFPRVVCDPGSLNPAPLGQEMLHGYGLNHARLDGSTADYRDPFDVMSVFVADSAMDPNFPACVSLPGNKLIGPGLNAALMDSKHWLDPERVWVYAGSNDPVQLRPHHRRDLPGFLVAKIGPFYVEFRMNEGFDAGIPFPLVLVHRFDWTDQHSYLMPATDGGQSLGVGSAFDILIPLMNPSGWGGRIVVTVTQIDPVQRVATLSLEGTTWGPGPGTAPVTGTGTGTAVTGTGRGTGTRGTAATGTATGTGTMFRTLAEAIIASREYQETLVRAIALLDDVPINLWDLGVLVELHRRLLSPSHPHSGQLRTNAGVVRFNGKVQKELPSPPESVAMAGATLNRLKAILQGTREIDWMAVAAETMLRLIEAHPFKDGNGRVSRAVATWLLIKGGYEVTSYPGLYCRQHVDEYYAAVVRAIERQPSGEAQADGRKLWDQFFGQMVRACFEPPMSR